MRLAVVGAALAASLVVATPAVAAIGARLDGAFDMRGTVTRAVRVRGERVGQVVSRRWTFSSSCATVCPRLTLVRRRAGGTDTLTLNRVRAGVYSGSSFFYVPLLCDGVLVARGGKVPFTIGVRIDAARKIGGVRTATAIHATYTNPRRVNLTSCPGSLGHDAAAYSGHRVG